MLPPEVLGAVTVVAQVFGRLQRKKRCESPKQDLILSYFLIFCLTVFVHSHTYATDVCVNQLPQVDGNSTKHGKAWPCMLSSPERLFREQRVMPAEELTTSSAQTVRVFVS